MSTQLPPRPNLDHFKNQAKAILKGQRSGDPAALDKIRENHPQWRNAANASIQRARFALSDAQLVIAKEYGFESWAKLKAHVVNLKDSLSSEELVRAFRDAAGRGDLDQLSRLLKAHPGLLNERGGPGTRTALHSALECGREAAALIYLLACRRRWIWIEPPVERRQRRGRTPKAAL